MYRVALLALLVAASAACDEAAPTAPTRSELVSHTWRLQSIRRSDGTSVTVATPDRFTLQFADNGRLSVRADCNSCGGNYQLNGSELVAGALACTRAFCGSDSLDTEFLRVFESAAAAVVADGELFITRAGARLAFKP